MRAEREMEELDTKSLRARYKNNLCREVFYKGEQCFADISKLKAGTW